MQTLSDGNSATYYTYDIHGNVDTLVQDYNTGMGTIAGNRFKKMVYSYDLISGKVNYVAYQPNAADAFYHRYGYDAENKLTKVETSKDAVYWETDATYDYYRHGPLAKTITGELQVQSVTNAYTIQGWIKGVVPGNDANQLIARQAFNYGLGYFTGDYTPIGNVANPFASIALTTSGAGVSLYNGNIAAMLIDIPKLGNAMLHTYNYDQLNRIKAVSNYTSYNATANSWTATQANNETVSFDPNGNIQTATLNGAATSLPYENFAYTYDAVKQNRLLSITNTIGSTVTTSNYDYDAIGNMTKDELEGNLNMQWSVYDKLLHSEKSNGTQINYTYDANDKCISKTITIGGSTATTYYVRDASGNIMVTYQKDAAVNSGKLSTTAYQLYGSSNMGAWKKVVDVESAYTIPTTYTFTRGEHEYYFSNHLGNNYLVLSDKKLQVSTNTTTIDYYKADILNATDYSAYGEKLIGREFNGSGITYGFNGKINNPETGYQDYGFRDYCAKSRRFTSVDPLTKNYPWYTPYQFAGNMPIQNIDLDGEEPAKPISNKAKTVLIVPYTAGTNGYSFNSAFYAAMKNPKIDVIRVNDVKHLSLTLQGLKKKYNNLVIADHAGISRESTTQGISGQAIGYYRYDKKNTEKFGKYFQEIGKSVRKEGNIILLGCMLAAPQYLGNDYLTAVAQQTGRKVYGDQGETWIGNTLFESKPLGGPPAQSDNSVFYYPVALANAGKWTLATPEGKTIEVGNLKLDKAGNPSTIPVQTQANTSTTDSDSKKEEKISTPPPGN